MGALTGTGLPVGRARRAASTQRVDLRQAASTTPGCGRQT